MNEHIFKAYKQFLTWFGDQMVATKPPKVKAENILRLLAEIQPGDVICRKYTYYFDSYLIPGEYSHSGIVYSKDMMYHSISEGVGPIHPIDFIKDCDGFIIVRPAYVDLTKTLARCDWHVSNKTQYDFTFKDKDKYYCHEFTCDCLSMGGVIIPTVIKKFGVFPFRFQRVLYLAEQIILGCEIRYFMG